MPMLILSIFFSSPKWANYIHDNPRPATQSLDDYLSVDNYKNYLKSKVVTNSDKTNSMISNPSDDDIAKILDIPANEGWDNVL